MNGGPDELLTLAEVLAELKVPRSTFGRWRQRGAGPPVIRLPSGSLRVSRAALTQWLHSLENDPEGPPT
jgi:predicted DNA-binding transcriptional regulator AlpA